MAVPFLGLPYGDPKYEPQKGTTMEPMGIGAYKDFGLFSAQVQVLGAFRPSALL